MKKAFYFLISCLILIGCKQEITNNDISKINGYWEIEKVILADGSKKEYNINETIDFFEIKENKGFRQKVMPQLDGKYLTNGIKETITITNSEEDYYINYSTKYGIWKEEIIAIQDSVLVLKNKDNIEYHYKKQIPFSVK